MDDLNSEQLLQEFNRLSALKNDCEDSMGKIRNEWNKRKDAKIELLQGKLDDLPT